MRRQRRVRQGIGPRQPIRQTANGAEFLAQATTEQLYFPVVRPNSQEANCNPWQIIEPLALRSSLNLCVLPLRNRDCFFNPQGGYEESGEPRICVEKKR